MSAGTTDSRILLDVRGLTVDTVPSSPRAGAPRRILEQIDFDLARRQVLGVIGESGAGKTVLARALAGWMPEGLRISGGSVRYLGQDLAHMPAAELARVRGNEIGYIGSDPTRALDPTVTIGAQLVEKLLAVRPQMGRKEALEKVIAVLAAVRIPSPARRSAEYPFQFSGGMMQRVMIADALLSEPAFLVADNITQPLDVTVAAQILRLLRELVDEFNTAIVFVSASLPVVTEVADKVLVLQAGRLIERGSPQALAATPREPYTQELIRKIPAIWTAAAGTIARAAPAGASGSGTILDVRGVSKTYRVRDRSAFNKVHEVRAVRNVSFSVARGESLGIVGESGCGKSTLTRLLTMLEAPDVGSIEFNGQDLARLPGRQLRRLRQEFQLLLQDPYNSLPGGRTIGDIIMEPLEIHGLATGKQARTRALEVMGEVGLDRARFADLPVGLSAGQRQRINVARALVLDPKLLILDETMSSLDQVEQSRLLDLFERLYVQHGLTYVYISHDLAMVRRVCNRVAVMYLGEVVELADNETLYRDPGHPYSRALLSAIPTVELNPFDPRACLLEGEPPSPVELPAGCGFANRCPQASERCRSVPPPVVERGAQASSRCFEARTIGQPGVLHLA